MTTVTQAQPEQSELDGGHAIGAATHEDRAVTSLFQSNRSSITRNAATLVIIFLLTLALALPLGNIPLLSLGLFALFLSLLGLMVLTPSDLKLQRQLSKTTAWVGDDVTVEWDITVRGGIGPVFVRDPLPEDLELVSGTNYRVFWKSLREARFINSYTIRCPKRGSYHLTPTNWESRHPLNLRQPLRGAGRDTSSLSVLPRVMALRRIRSVRGLARTPYPMMDLSRIGVVTTDFREIRNYVAGDPVRLINWKATARMAMAGAGGPLVNQFELEGKKAIWMFLDSSSYMGVGTTLRNPLEHAIEAASGIGYYYLTRGYYLGAHMSGRPNQMMYPDTGKRQFHRLVQELITLEPRLNGYDLPQAVHVCRSQIARYSPRCVIITRLDAAVRDSKAVDPAHQKFLVQGIERLLAFSATTRRRLSIWIVALNGYNYAYAPGGDAVADVGKTIRTMETRPLVHTLRGMGVSVLEWNPLQEEFAQVLLRQIRMEKH